MAPEQAPQQAPPASRRSVVSNFADQSTYFDDGASMDMSSIAAGDGAGGAGGAGLSPPSLGLQETLAQNETKAVRRLRWLMFFVLITVAILASLGVYYYSRDQEQNQFESEFLGQGFKVIDGFQGDSFRKLQALETLSKSITAYTLESSSDGVSKWPFVTIPDSANHFQPYLSLANAASLLVMPIVKTRQRSAWERYSVANQGWIDEDLETQRTLLQQQQPSNRRLLQQLELEEQQHNITTRLFMRDLQINSDTLREEEEGKVSWYIKNYVGIDTSPGDWLIWWQYAPVLPNRWFINFNRMAVSGFAKEVKSVIQDGLAAVSKTWTFDKGLDFQSTRDLTFNSDLLKAGGGNNGNYTLTYEPGEPIGYIHYPVFDSYNVDERDTVAVLTATVYWRSYFQEILSDTVKGIVCVVENSLGQAFTYRIDGEEATFLGMDDLHDEKYTDFAIDAEYSDFTAATSNHYTGVPIDRSYISYRIKVYPSQEFEKAYVTNKPAMYALAMVFIFVFTAVIFQLYDFCVERRQKIVMKTAVQTNAVISSLFPENVRDRLMEQSREHHEHETSFFDKDRIFLTSTRHESPRQRNFRTSKPIADFFPETTIMFADIRGFTAWSSVREPSQVFTLLETLYNAFDRLAKRRGVFKVETIGDCYVAVAGLPQPRKDHAVAMCRFAHSCLEKVHILTKELELELGFGTADLTMRFGLHSGPVTAGVLRGEKSRFQLFGDTMNTAARMESTGERDKIQISQATADLLIAAGKSKWVTPREGKVFAKGKGEMQTYWVNIEKAASSEKMSASGRYGGAGSSTAEEDRSDSGGSDTNNNNTMDLVTKFEEMALSSGELRGASKRRKSYLSGETTRLIKWNVEVLRKLLEQVASMRRSACAAADSGFSSLIKSNSRHKAIFIEDQKTTGCCARDEVKEIIKLPAFHVNMVEQRKRALENKVELSEEVKEELLDYVTSIAQMYRKNAFHNFEHASHVSMSVNKLMKRIVSPTDLDFKSDTTIEEIASKVHQQTYGITSDPLTQFACVFSAIVHDVDHTGVPNSQLVKENEELAALYRNKSVAEQVSIDVAWNLLMEERYKNLRNAMYTNDEERQRFRELLVNSVMATDIFDKELKELRNKRWETAFSEQQESESKGGSSGSSGSSSGSSNDNDNINRKATIVIEHLIQASDVAHTMQHWHVYRKWNENLFMEMSQAYEQGRSETDPADHWYEGELGFFDFYIIPLAKKLKECGVFGVSSDEFLTYAENNRREWEEKGKDIVREMVELRNPENVHAMFGSKPSNNDLMGLV